VSRQFRDEEMADPFLELAGVYPDEALDEMASYYAQQLVAA
jgi:hypothetical protein